MAHDSNEEAAIAVNRFVARFDESYRLLARYAALPLVLTPELLNYLHSRFLHDQVPWVAEADLLLSEVCRRVGYEQYVMDAGVRAYLIGEMRNEPDGRQRMQEVARLLIAYVEHLARTNPLISERDLQQQQWAALVCLDEHRVADGIAESFQRMLPAVGAKGEAGRAELLSLANLTQHFAPQLQGHPELIEYAKNITQVLRQPKLDEQTIQKRRLDQPVVIDGRRLAAPASLRATAPKAADPSVSKTSATPAMAYVVMGFGKKTDFETGRTIDLDMTYRNIIKPAVLAAGLQCIRADEIRHSGLIEVPAYEQLLNADVVIADLSTSNKNAYYELGIRHGLRPYTTVIICEDGTKTFPFDVNHVPLQQYHHMGEGIDYDEVERFRTTLTNVIVAAEKQDPRSVDSPVYNFLTGLQPGILGTGGLEEPDRGSFQQAATKDRTCYVTMGFGRKTDFETGHTLDLDKSYQNIIKPAVEAAGLTCIRADEIVHSGLIDVPMYEQLLKADVVVADLSTSNKNAFYELGVRHALRPYTTVVIAEDGIKTFPFDVNHVAVRQYHHLGEDIAYDEVMRFRDLLTKAIVQIGMKEPPAKDSPVYMFLNGLNPPALAAAMQGVAEAAAKSAPAVDGESDGKAESKNGKVYSVLMEEVEKAKNAENFEEDKTLLMLLREEMKPKKLGTAGLQEPPEDPYIIQQLALVTYKAKQDSPEKEIAALREARDLLSKLNPATSNDTETLVLWGAVHKRLWDKARDAAALDEALRSYERGFSLRHDYYNGINFAFLLNVRAVNTADSEEAIADSVQARRVCKEVVQICEDWLAANPEPTGSDGTEDAFKKHVENKYWVLATLAEAHVGLRENESAERRLGEAYAIASADWMKEATQSQLDALRRLIENSPSDRVPAA